MFTPINVGYIGLGNIGKPCAVRLIAEPYTAHVFDVYQPAVDELVEKGAIGCGSVAELANLCKHIGICVRDEQQVEALLYGDEGIFASAQKDTLVAIHSTVNQASLLKWAKEATELGIYLIDAPITGGAHKAADGALCYMVGGDADLVARSRSVFDTSAERVIHAGDLGAGIALKLCNNFIQYTEFVVMAEATRLAEACGLSIDMLREVGLHNGVVNEQMHSFVAGRNGLVRSSSTEQMDEYFGAMGRLGEKDLQCALDTAAGHNVTLPTANYVRDRILDVFLALDESRPTD